MTGLRTGSSRLYGLGAAAALGVVALIPVQMAAFVAWPTPSSAVDAFALFRQNALAGLVAFDLLLIASWSLSVVVFFALAVALWDKGPLRAGAALALELVAFAAYLSSNTAFSLLTLAERHAAATGGAERDALVAAGEAMLALYTGTAFNVSYVLSGAAALLLGLVMLRAPAFGRTTAYLVIAYAVLQIPPTAGPVGMGLALLSLLPMIAWLLLAARALRRLASADRER